MKYPLQIISVIVVIHCDGKYLLVQRDHNDSIFPGMWQNLGGKVELGERIEKAIKRETKEEIGISIKPSPVFLQSYSWEKDKDSPVRLGLIYLNRLDDRPDKYKIAVSSELANYSWFTFAEAKNMNEKGKLIAKDSSTGTFGQLQKAEMVVNRKI